MTGHYSRNVHGVADGRVLAGQLGAVVLALRARVGQEDGQRLSERLEGSTMPSRRMSSVPGSSMLRTDSQVKEGRERLPSAV